MCYPLWQSLLHIPWTPTPICHEWEKYPPSDSVCFHFQSSLCSGHFQGELSLTNLIEETKRLCPFFSLHTQNSPQEKEHRLNLLFPCSGDVIWHYIFIMYYITTYFFSFGNVTFASMGPPFVYCCFGEEGWVNVSVSLSLHRLPCTLAVSSAGQQGCILFILVSHPSPVLLSGLE